MTDLPPIPVPPPPASPTAEDVQRLVRAQNWRTAALLLPLVAIVIGVVWYTASTRAGAKDSFNATDVFLANQPRSACITERRNAELDAIGDQNDALGRAQIAGFFRSQQEVLAPLFLDGIFPDVATEVAAFVEASVRRGQAADSLSAEVLDLPPDDGGCGPPILSLDDLPDD